MEKPFGICVTKALIAGRRLVPLTGVEQEIRFGLLASISILGLDFAASIASRPTAVTIAIRLSDREGICLL
jgi:hypothetical protein